MISSHLFANDIKGNLITVEIEHVQTESETKGFNITFLNLSKSNIVVMHLRKFFVKGFALNKSQDDPKNRYYTYSPTLPRSGKRVQTVWMKLPPKESYKVFVPISHFLKRDYDSYKGEMTVLLLHAGHGIYNNDLNKVLLKHVHKSKNFKVNITKKGIQNISSKKVIKLDSKKYDETRKYIK